MNALLTVDELRALSRSFGTPLPAALVSDDDADEATDRAARRGLVARGLASGPVDAIVPVAALAAVLDALSAATTMVGIERDGYDGIRRLVAAADDHGPVLTLNDQGDGLWLSGWHDDVPAVIAASLGDALAADSDGVGEVPGGPGFVCPAAAHAAADEALLAGRPDEAVRTLVAGGVDREIAVRWVTAIDDRRAAFSVDVATANGAGWDLAGIHAVVGGDGTCWRVDTEADPTGDISPDRSEDGLDGLDGLQSVVEIVPPGELLSAVLGLFDRHPVAEGVGR